jgi:histo-blood group ABO system transferase
MKLAIITVATGKYLEYWMDLVRSVNKQDFSNIEISYNIFTDRIQDAKNFSDSVLNIKIIVQEINSQDWLDGTIMRYSHYRKYFRLITGDVILHLDADMLVVDRFAENLIDEVKKNTGKLSFVQHPGYWRKNKIYWPYLFSYKTYKNEIYNLLKVIFKKSLGSWETRSNSAAYISKKQRKQYYCGAVWFGEKEIAHNFICEMDDLINYDRSRGVTAIWHDESYLNKWATINPHNYVSPKYCSAPDRPHLSAIKPLIVVVDKSNVS